MNLGTMRLRGRWQDEIREDGRIIGEEGWQKKVHNRGMEAAPENGKELSYSAHAKGINEYIQFKNVTHKKILQYIIILCKAIGIYFPFFTFTIFTA